MYELLINKLQEKNTIEVDFTNFFLDELNKLDSNSNDEDKRKYIMNVLEMCRLKLITNDYLDNPPF